LAYATAVMPPWIAYGSIAALMLIGLLLTRASKRRASRGLRETHSQLTLAQKRARAAQSVAWYFNLPLDRQTPETWDMVIRECDRELSEVASVSRTLSTARRA
jgi:hypothetical protein